MARISHSKTELYQLCPAKYKFRYIDKLKADVTHSPLLFGTAIDNALNYVLESMRDGKEWTVDECKSIFIDRMNDWDGSNRLEFFNSEVPDELAGILEPKNRDHQEKIWNLMCERGLKCIDVYIAEILPQFKRIVSVQNSGAIKNEEGDEFVFVVDFVAEMHDGRIVLFDNKTSSAKYPKNKVIESQQLSLYLDTFPEIKYAGYCVMIKNPEKVGFKSTYQLMIDEIPEETTAKAYALIEKTLLGIKNQQFEVNRKGCYAFGKRCEYFDLCNYNDDSGLVPDVRKVEVPQGEKV